MSKRREIAKVVRVGQSGYRIQFHDGTKQDITNQTAGNREPLPGDILEITGTSISVIPRTS